MTNVTTVKDNKITVNEEIVPYFFKFENNKLLLFDKFFTSKNKKTISLIVIIYNKDIYINKSFVSHLLRCPISYVNKKLEQSNVYKFNINIAYDMRFIKFDDFLGIINSLDLPKVFNLNKTIKERIKYCNSELLINIESILKEKGVLKNKMGVINVQDKKVSKQHFYIGQVVECDIDKNVVKFINPIDNLTYNMINIQYKFDEINKVYLNWIDFIEFLSCIEDDKLESKNHNIIYDYYRLYVENVPSLTYFSLNIYNDSAFYEYIKVNCSYYVYDRYNFLKDNVFTILSLIQDYMQGKEKVPTHDEDVVTYINSLVKDNWHPVIHSIHHENDVETKEELVEDNKSNFVYELFTLEDNTLKKIHRFSSNTRFNLAVVKQNNDVYLNISFMLVLLNLYSSHTDKKLRSYKIHKFNFDLMNGINFKFISIKDYFDYLEYIELERPEIAAKSKYFNYAWYGLCEDINNLSNIIKMNNPDKKEVDSLEEFSQSFHKEFRKNLDIDSIKLGNISDKLFDELTESKVTTSSDNSIKSEVLQNIKYQFDNIYTNIETVISRKDVLETKLSELKEQFSEYKKTSKLEFTQLEKEYSILKEENLKMQQATESFKEALHQLQDKYTDMSLVSSDDILNNYVEKNKYIDKVQELSNLTREYNNLKTIYDNLSEKIDTVSDSNEIDKLRQENEKLLKENVDLKNKMMIIINSNLDNILD